ncbi:DNA2, partial [Symbiodinium sp. KB8]
MEFPECITDFHVGLFLRSPFLAFAVLNKSCPPLSTDSFIGSCNKAISAEALQHVCHSQKCLDLGELDPTSATKTVVSAISDESADIILGPRCRWTDGVMTFEGTVDALFRQGKRGYVLKVVSTGEVVPPQCITRAAFFHHLVSKHLGSTNKLEQEVHILRGDGHEEVLNIAKYQELLESQRASFVKFLKQQQPPEPTSNDLRSRPEHAELARRRLLELDSLLLIPSMSPSLQRMLKRAGIETLSKLCEASGVKKLPQAVFHQLRRHARHQRGDIEIDGAFVRKGRESGIALDVVEGSSPLENVFLIGQSGQESIRELAATSTDLEQLTHMANMPEVYFFGQRVWENILLSCLAVERADLASKVVERIYCEPAWIDVQARLKSICMSDSIQDMLRKLAGGLGQDESFQLPKLMEMSRCQVLAQAKQREAKQRFSTLAKAKIGALQQLAAFAQGQPQDEPTFGVRDVLIRDLLSLCRSFGGRAQNLGGWPQEVWQTARKWPSYYKHDLFWGLIDAIELFKAPAHSWTAHTLCLSHLVRVEDNPQIKQYVDRKFTVEEVELTYTWDVDQETSIKEKDEVLVRGSPSMRGKVKTMIHAGTGRQSKIVLVFDTRFGKNPNLHKLVGPDYREICAMQAKFSIQNGENIMTRAVEQRISEVTKQTWSNVQQSFRSFLMKIPRADPVSASRAEEVVRSMDSQYLVIQGPPGTGKTFTSAQIISSILLAEPNSQILVSSNSHKAIRNLLTAVANLGVNQVGKVMSQDETEQEIRGEGCVPVANGRFISLPFGCRVAGGTASQLMKLGGSFDYLFVDEAGQVTLELLAVLGGLAQNLVLVGDQQQLPPPVQDRLKLTKAGGMSCLEYVTEGEAIISPYRGIFLSRTYRMSDRLTEVVSRNFYAGGLEAAPRNAGNRLILAPGLLTVDTGAEFVQVPHENNFQSSEEECQVVQQILRQLLESQVVLDDHDPRSLKPEDVIIVCPYNAQVVMVRSTMAANPAMRKIRVGSVDLFQGQEAAVALVSLGASCGRLPFVLDPNRTRGRGGR